MQIFISYGRGDAAEMAAQLAAWLRSQGFEPWLDIAKGVPIGAPFDIRIEEGIAESDLMIALLSPWSLRPESFCRNEILYAQALRKPIIPVRIAPVVPPIQIVSLSYLDACGNPQAVFAELPRVIEEVRQTGQMPWQDWQAAQPGGPWWSAVRPLDFQEELARHGGSFVGRGWLFRRIQEWLESPGSRVLLLTGEPGVGKSAIAAQLTARLNVRGFHFCSRSNVDSCRPRAWLAWLVYQLCAQYPAYRNRVEQFQRPNWAADAESLFRTLIADPLRRCRDELEIEEPWVLIVDALDESLAAGGPDLAHLLASSLCRLPDWFRLILTSRPDRDLLAMFRQQEVEHLNLEAGGQANREDLRLFIERRAPQLNISAGAIKNLCEAAKGNFLFAEMALQELGSMDSAARQAAEAAGRLPANLGGLYYGMFEKRFPDQAKYEQQILPLLNCLAAARGPLPEALLQKAAEPDQQVALKGLQALWQFLSAGQAGVRLFHESLAEWLRDPDRSARFAASVADGHRRLAEAGWQEYRANPETMSAYSLDHLPVHLAEAGRWAELLELASPSGQDLITRWVDKGESDTGLVCLPGMMRFLERQAQQPRLAAGLSTQLARIHSTQGRYEEAEKWLRHALSKTSWRRARRIRAVALHELASLALYRWRPKEAGALYSRALRLCRWIPPVQRDEVAANLLGLATVAYTTYRFKTAMRLAGRALRQARRAGDAPHEIAARRLLGAACKILGRYAEAETHLQAALTLSESHGAAVERARALLLRGYLLYDLAVLEEAEPAAAIPIFEEALDAAERAQDLVSILDSQLALGLCALAVGKTEKATEHLQSAADCLPRGCHPDLAGQLRVGLAAAAHQRGDWQEAVSLYERVLEHEARSAALSACSKACVGLGAIAWHSGRREQAQQHWREALRWAGAVSAARRSLAEHSIRLCQADPRVAPR